MADQVLSGCLDSEALSEERQAQFPTAALPNQGTSPFDQGGCELARVLMTWRGENREPGGVVLEYISHALVR